MTLPCDFHAERNVISALITDPEAQDTYLSEVCSDDFIVSENKIIFDAISVLDQERSPIDPIHLKYQLQKIGKFEEIGGSSFVDNLHWFDDGELESFILKLKEKAKLRSLHWISVEMQKRTLEGIHSSEKILQDFEKKIFDLNNSRLNRTAFTVKEILEGKHDSTNGCYEEKIHKRVQKRLQSPDALTGLPTHYPDLDRKLDGLKPGNLTLIAGRPGIGKTTFLMNLVNAMAFKNQVGVAIFSLEMSIDQLMDKAVSQRSKVLLSALSKGYITEKEQESIRSSIQELKQQNIIIDGKADIKMSELRSRCKRLKEVSDIKVIFIDYLQLISGDMKQKTRYEQVSEISRDMKVLARSLDLSVICLAQLSRKPVDRSNNKPIPSDLRDSGSLEQDADEILLLFEDAQPGILNIDVAKNRFGDTGTIKVVFDKEFGTMESYSSQIPDPFIKMRSKYE